MAQKTFIKAIVTLPQLSLTMEVKIIAMKIKKQNRLKIV